MSNEFARPGMGLYVKTLSSPLLNQCSLAVSDGEIAAISGPSGSGKTVLLRAIADLDPNTGEVRLDGASRNSMSAPQWRRQVRFVPAEAAWWADRVADHFRSAGDAAERAAEIGLPPESLTWEVARLSTGEKQRLGLLRALEDAPSVLLLDEPTAALDPESEAMVEALLQRLQAKGTAIILVTHSSSQADRLSGRRYTMRDGRLSEEP
jgi:ABC-type iron transport system FetAB ATPase subunit